MSNVTYTPRIKAEIDSKTFSNDPLKGILIELRILNTYMAMSHDETIDIDDLEEIE